MSERYVPYATAAPLPRPLKPAPERIGRKFDGDDLLYAQFRGWYSLQFNKLPEAGNSRARAIASLMWLAWYTGASL